MGFMIMSGEVSYQRAKKELPHSWKRTTTEAGGRVSFASVGKERDFHSKDWLKDKSTEESDSNSSCTVTELLEEKLQDLQRSLHAQQLKNRELAEENDELRDQLVESRMA